MRGDGIRVAGYGGELNISAMYYDQTDAQGGANLGKQMHPR